MRQQAQQLLKRISTVLLAQQLIILAVVTALVVGMALVNINRNSGTGRDEARYEESRAALKSFKFDDNAITQIRGLQGQDFVITPELSDNRTNPFGQ